ncbi:MAG: hypothetical protein ACOY9J_05245 [Pseudomonadota bacterium]
MKKLIPALVVVLAGLVQVAVAENKPVDPGASPANPPAAAAAPTATVDEIPADIGEEMNKLVEMAVQGASAPLQQGDDFPPYGVLLMADGTLQAVRWNKPNPPPPIEMFRQIFLATRAQATKPDVVAAVTVAPTSVPTTDGAMRVNGIRAEVDHRRGAPRLVFIPYVRENGKLVLGTTVYQPGVNPIFEHGSAAAAPAPKTPAAGAKGAAAKGKAAAVKKTPAQKPVPAGGGG